MPLAIKPKANWHKTNLHLKLLSNHSPLSKRGGRTALGVLLATLSSVEACRASTIVKKIGGSDQFNEKAHLKTNQIIVLQSVALSLQTSSIQL